MESTKEQVRAIGLDQFINNKVNIKEYENFKRKYKRKQILSFLTAYLTIGGFLIFLLVNLYLMFDLQQNTFLSVPDMEYMGGIYIKYSAEVKEATAQEVRNYYKLQMDGVHLPMEKEDEEFKEKFVKDYVEKTAGILIVIGLCILILIGYLYWFIYSMLSDEYSLLGQALDSRKYQIIKEELPVEPVMVETPIADLPLQGE